MTNYTPVSFSLPALLYVVNGGIPGIVDGGDGLEEVQGLLSAMTGHPIYLHQIPRAADVCAKYLIDQYPWLDGMRPNAEQVEDVQKLKRWVKACTKRMGDRMRVPILPGDAYTYMDPIVEFTQSLEGTKQGAGLAGSND